MYWFTSKSLTSAAILTGSLVVSKRLTGPAALIPPRTLLQSVAGSLPLGEITPMPVMTTRRSGRSMFIGLVIAGSQSRWCLLEWTGDGHDIAPGNVGQSLFWRP